MLNKKSYIMIQTDSISSKTDSSKIPEKTEVFFHQKINRYTIIVIGGCFLFFISGILNFIDEYLKGWSYTRPILGYLLFGFTVLCLIPIAIGTREIVTNSFTSSSRILIKQASRWLHIYALTVLLNIIVMGWPLVSIIVSVTIIFGRVLGFYYLSKSFKKIGHLSNLKIGGFLYQIYGLFYIVIAILGGVASIVNDEAISNLVFISNGFIESTLIILISVKISYDILQIRKYKIIGKANISGIQKILDKQRNNKRKLTTEN